MRKNQCHLCHDAHVLRTAECRTDHKLLRVKLKLCPPSRKPQAKRVERLDVDMLRSKGKREEFEREVGTVG